MNKNNQALANFAGACSVFWQKYKIMQEMKIKIAQNIKITFFCKKILCYKVKYFTILKDKSVEGEERFCRSSFFE